MLYGKCVEYLGLILCLCYQKGKKACLKSPLLLKTDFYPILFKKKSDEQKNNILLFAISKLR
jgi:hypothetical protein